MPLSQHPNKFIIWTVNSITTFDSPGAGIYLPIGIVYSTGFPIFRELFTAYVFLFYFYAYWKVSPIHPTENVKKSLLIWRGTTFLFLFAVLRSIVFRLCIFEDFTLIFVLPSFVGLVLLMIVIIVYPESFLISHSQIKRIFDLYEIGLDEEKDKEAESRYDEQIIDYLQSIPKEILTEQS